MNLQTIIVLLITLIILVIVIKIVIQSLNIVLNTHKDSAKDQLKLFVETIESLAGDGQEVSSQSLAMRLDSNFAIVYFRSGDFKSMYDSRTWPMWPDGESSNYDITGGFRIVPPSMCYEKKEDLSTFTPCICLYSGKPDFKGSFGLTDYFKLNEYDKGFWKKVDDKVVTCVNAPVADPPLTISVLAWQPTPASLSHFGGSCMVFNEGWQSVYTAPEEGAVRKLMASEKLMTGEKFDEYFGTSIVEMNFEKQLWYLHPVEFFGMEQTIGIPALDDRGRMYSSPAKGCGLYDLMLNKVVTDDATSILITHTNAAHFLKKALFQNKICPINDNKCVNFSTPPQIPEFQNLQAEFRFEKLDSAEEGYCYEEGRCDAFTWPGQEPPWIDLLDIKNSLKNAVGSYRGCFVIEYRYRYGGAMAFSEAKRDCAVIDGSSAQPNYLLIDPMYLVYQELNTPCSGQPGTTPVCTYNYLLDCQVTCMDSTNPVNLAQDIEQSYLGTAAMARVYSNK